MDCSSAAPARSLPVSGAVGRTPPPSSLPSLPSSASTIRLPSAFTVMRRTPKVSEASIANPEQTDPSTLGDSENTDVLGFLSKKEKNVPVEHSEGYARTRGRVAEAAINILGTAGMVAHELLEVGTDVLRFAPIVGLEEAARTLLHIWDSLELVSINRLTCLRIMERCATVLMSIREEIADAGDKVGIELRPPLKRLVDSFREVHRFLRKQSNHPFIKRYLRRDEIQRALAACHSSLTDALGMFNTSIQVRILKQVLAAEDQRKADTAALQDSINRRPQVILIEPPAHPLFTADPLSLDPEYVSAQLQLVTTRENDRAAVQEAVDLRQILRTALKAKSPVEMVRILQVGHDEMPEAIKALQRLLEKEIERARLEQEPVLVSAMGAAVDVRQMDMSVPEGFKRSSTAHSTGSHTSSSVASSAGTGRSRAPRDTLDREFIEMGIDALKRLNNLPVRLPNWTITRYEVERDETIGAEEDQSQVYKGTWGNRVVAIKTLAPMTPRQLFVDKVLIWKTLQHPNVCELLGASSAFSDPPWFFVSPYYKYGSLVTYLKGLPSLDSVDLLKMTHEITKGMAYLHSKGVLHGDLKAANVLVNDKHHCIISDFGQSEMKTEAYRISGMPLPHGSLRWQAPELMSGQSNLTQEIDVYAFAITVVELLTMGALPWPLADDDTVRHYVLREDMRPDLPLEPVCSQQLTEILHQCWNRDPAVRPSFAKVDQQVQKLRAHPGPDVNESHRATAPCVSQTEPMPVETCKSSDTHPAPLPPPATSTRTASNTSFMTAPGSPDLDSQYPRPLSPVPQDKHAQKVRDERRYRMLLQHEFHPSLTLPLWTPSPIAIGAVGYHSKANYGEFVTLFNCFDPQKTSGGRTGNMPSALTYGPVDGRLKEGQRHRRSVARWGMDVFQSLWPSTKQLREPPHYLRSHSSQLQSGRRSAGLITQSTSHIFLEDLEAPTEWFIAQVDRVLAIYEVEHHLLKEDLRLVVGKLEARDYAFYVSHEHPDGVVAFNVFTQATARARKAWGNFSFSFDHSTSSLGGLQFTQKISPDGTREECDSVLLAPLRFKPDALEPTLDML